MKLDSTSFFASLTDAQLKRSLKRLAGQVMGDDRAFRAARALSRPPTLIEIEVGNRILAANSKD